MTTHSRKEIQKRSTSTIEGAGRNPGCDEAGRPYFQGQRPTRGRAATIKQKHLGRGEYGWRTTPLVSQLNPISKKKGVGQKMPGPAKFAHIRNVASGLLVKLERTRRKRPNFIHATLRPGGGRQR
jgi:hypothetical protein